MCENTLSCLDATKSNFLRTRLLSIILMEMPFFVFAPYFFSIFRCLMAITARKVIKSRTAGPRFNQCEDFLIYCLLDRDLYH